MSDEQKESGVSNKTSIPLAAMNLHRLTGDNSKYSLDNILLSGNRIYATDGRGVIRLELAGAEPCEPIHIPSDLAKKVLACEKTRCSRDAVKVQKTGDIIEIEAGRSGDSVTFEKACHCGDFPNISLDKMLDQAAQIEYAEIDVDPQRLAEMLLAIAPLAKEGEYERVTLKIPKARSDLACSPLAALRIDFKDEESPHVGIAMLMSLKREAVTRT